MQNPNVHPMKTQHPPKPNIKAIKTYKYSHRSTYKSYKYAEIGFTISKQNKKYVAICKICNRTLGNTAYARLKGHRNICKLPSPDESLETEHLTSNIDNETYLTKYQIDFLSQECVSQTSTGDSRLTFNVITPKIESVECQISENVGCGNYPDDHQSSKLFPYCNPEQESQILDEENQLKLSMIEVLLPIRNNKQLLFKDTTKESTEVWMEVLKKAQSLGLAPTDVPWTYARDSLYFAWRFHTQQKKDAIQLGENSVKLNIVDLAILQIENVPITSENSNFEHEKFFDHNETTSADRVRENSNSSSKTDSAKERTNSISTQTSDEMFKADLRLKQLQCEAMEIENYKRSLEVFELELKLKIPPSKHTVKYIPTAQNHPTEHTNWEMYKGTRC